MSQLLKAPLMGLLFVVFLPVIGFVLLAKVLLDSFLEHLEQVLA